MENQKTILESAIGYEPKKTFNVSELPSVDVTLKLEDREGLDESGKTFSYQVTVVEGKEYRVPGSVLEELKKALKIRSDIKKFKVNRTGAGLHTRYSVEILE